MRALMRATGFARPLIAAAAVLALAGCGHVHDVLEGRCSVQLALGGTCVMVYAPWSRVEAPLQ
jgi:hypothetical protein